MSDIGENADPGFQGDLGFQADQNGQPGSGGPVDLANPFLRNIPDADKEIVARYIKDWDRGVNQRFQQIHQQYAPYQQLGADPQQLSQALNVYQMLQSDPARVREIIDQHLAEQEQANAPPEYAEQLPPEFLGRFEKAEQLLMGLAERFLETQRASTEQTEDQQLQDYMEALRSQYGEFDETYVLSKMINGMEGPQAVNEYNALVKSIEERAVRPYRPMPPILSGAGNVGNQNNTNLSKASGQEVRNMVAKILADSQSE